MVNSHFIPQLILRHFCVDDTIQYYNLAENKVESRSTKSVFSEKGYYPDQIETDLSHKIESQFGNLLNNKILSDGHKVVLDSKDQLILKKYLIISSLRVHDKDMQHNSWYQVLKRDGLIPDSDEAKDFFGGDFFDNLNEVLKCDDLNSLVETAMSSHNLNLFAFIRDVIYSYNIFVKTNNCKEDFLIPDRGWAAYNGPISVKKLNAMVAMLEQRYDPFIDQILHMSSPLDYAIFPITHDMAVITMSPVYSALSSGFYKIKYPDGYRSLSDCLGFGTISTYKDSLRRSTKNGMKEYVYDIKQLTKNDVIFLNSLLLNNAEKYFAYADISRVKSSLEVLMVMHGM